MCAFLIYGITFVGAGLWVDYAHKGKNFIGIFNPAHIWWSSFLWLFVSSLWWAYFVWQPIGISKVIGSLSQNGVIQPAQRDRRIGGLQDKLCIRFLGIGILDSLINENRFQKITG